jgi:hypothetical protein
MSTDHLAELYSGETGCNGFFDVTKSRKTASRLVSLVVEALGAPPKGVVDVGCALGVFLYESRRVGVEDVLGSTGTGSPGSRCRSPRSDPVLPTFAGRLRWPDVLVSP